MKIQILIIALLVVGTLQSCPYHTLKNVITETIFGTDNQQISERLEAVPPVTNNASQTVDSFFAEIQKSKYKMNPSFKDVDLTNVINVAKFTVESMTPTMENKVDYLPEGRKKYIHPRGSVAKIRFVATNYSQQNYDGLFKGADFGLIRFSLAGNPEALGFTPGLALKFFRNNGVESGNIIAMYNLDGQKDNYNFFENEFSNSIPEPTQMKLKFLETVVFRRVSSCPVFLSCQDFAQYDQNGNYFGYSPRTPRQIFFSPVTETQFSTEKFARPGVVKDFRDDLASVKTGSLIYNVYDDQMKLLGRIYSASEFVSSSFGDDVLFFKHRKGDDLGCPK